VIVLGHRGGRGEGWPAENSLAAFARALSEGADGVELDVRLAASGEPIVAHDRSLARATHNADRRKVDAVRRADLPRLEGGERIPDLEEALDLVHGRIVNVEVKADAPGRLRLVRAVVRALERARSVDVVISSFDPSVVLAFACLLPRIPRGMLVGPRTARLGTALPLAMRRSIMAAHLEDRLVSAARVDRLRGAGLRVLAWTVNDPARAVAMAEMGLSTVITDRPRAIVDALALRRQTA
jgi:glycerophosphoryl diester phosphodiesterase